MTFNFRITRLRINLELYARFIHYETGSPTEIEYYFILAGNTFV